MENAAKALEMAAAVFIFIIALAVAFSIITEARAASDTIFKSTDEVNSYVYVEGTAVNAKVTREVGIETIIPTLYRYNNESLRIVIIDGTSIIQVFDTDLDLNIKVNNVDKMKIPELKVINEVLGSNYTEEKVRDAYEGSLNDVAIGGSSKVPWSVDNKCINQRVDLFLKGSEGEKINGTKIFYDGFFENYKGSIFEERFIKYKTSGKVTEEGLVVEQGEEKTVIIYSVKK